MHFSLNVTCHFFSGGSISFLCFLLFLCFDFILSSFFFKKRTITWCLTSTFRSMSGCSFLARLQSQEKLAIRPLDLAAKNLLKSASYSSRYFDERLPLRYNFRWEDAAFSRMVFCFLSHLEIWLWVITNASALNAAEYWWRFLPATLLAP